MHSNYSNELKSLDKLTPEELSDKAKELIETYIAKAPAVSLENLGGIFATFIGEDHFDWKSNLDDKKYCLQKLILLMSNAKVAAVADEKSFSVEHLTAVCLRLLDFLTILSDEYSDYMELFALLHASDYNEKRCKITIGEYFRKIYIAEIDRDLDQQEEALKEQRKNQQY